MKRESFFKGPVKEGFYIYSSPGCEDCAIGVEYIETPDRCAQFHFSPDEARKFAKLLIEVANEYDEGFATGIDGWEYEQGYGPIGNVD